MAHGAGCGCKLGPSQLRDVLSALPGLPIDPNILVSGATSDDAAVIRVRDDLAIVATVDFFTPIVDDPATFGAIAATNALSDLYAMGATPLMSLAVAAFPKDGELSVLGEIMRGGAEVALAAGCPVLGGHTIDDAEPKYGLVAIGTVDPGQMMTNAAGAVGDLLVLTKPLGIGTIAAATKVGQAPAALTAAAVASMLTTNAGASDAARAAGVRCATDVTGFGLLGHVREMVAASGLGVALRVDRIPVIPGALELIAAGHVPGGTERNRAFLAEFVDFAETVTESARTLLFDPQTSGGLLLAIAPDRLPVLVTELGSRGVAGTPIGQLRSEPVGRIGVASRAVEET